MASRNAQKRRTRERKMRQGKAYELFKAAVAKSSNPLRLENISFDGLRQRVKHSVVELAKSVGSVRQRRFKGARRS